MLKKIFCLTAVLCSILHGSLCDRKQGNQDIPPPPPPPPPPAVKPTMATPSPTPQNVPPPPLTPAPLLPNQCSFGAANLDSVDSSGGYAEANTLYVLANDPAECSGIVDSIELCFYITGAVENSYSMQFLSFRKRYSSGGAVRSYRKFGASSVSLTTDAANGEDGGVICEIVDLDGALRLSEGDVLGFITEQGLRIAFSASEGRHVFRYVPSSEQRREKRLSDEQVSELQSISTTQLKQANTTATPVLKIVMNATNESSKIIPTPTSTPTANPEPDDCSGKKSSRERTISFFTFASAMVASAVMIAVLVVAVFVLLCCLCGCCACCGGCCDCKLCKILRACCSTKRCLCCHRKKGQGSQKVSGIHEQSMQYNELYLPTDQATGGQKQSTKLHENPAYGQQSASQSSRGLEHTYESVEVARTRMYYQRCAGACAF